MMGSEANIGNSHCVSRIEVRRVEALCREKYERRIPHPSTFKDTVYEVKVLVAKDLFGVHEALWKSKRSTFNSNLKPSRCRYIDSRCRLIDGEKD